MCDINAFLKGNSDIMKQNISKLDIHHPLSDIQFIMNQAIVNRESTSAAWKAVQMKTYIKDIWTSPLQSSLW